MSQRRIREAIHPIDIADEPVQKVAVLVGDGNFLAWKQHVLLIVKTHRLHMFLDGTVSIPSRLIVNEDGVSDENPLYVRYEQQDSALAAWLLSTISPSLHNQLVGSSGSSYELWQAIMRIFGSHSTTKAMRYRSLLHNSRKNALSMSEYLAEIKHLCDSLAGCGQPVVSVGLVLVQVVSVGLILVRVGLILVQAQSMLQPICAVPMMGSIPHIIIQTQWCVDLFAKFSLPWLRLN
ncbi:hypothetical protein J1N35_043535 [Gossypium stocksii]|uniref:Retrotransposon Copia-like N-terminal domain-containing protein n=1 Tax=Gossypium stocksii TaxID=47602 RepID=A0A9D3U7F8_9ROSI|nr:hypothetical protein J1N35_043535 [Gossypium stocksii]